MGERAFNLSKWRTYLEYDWILHAHTIVILETFELEVDRPSCPMSVALIDGQQSNVFLEDIDLFSCQDNPSNLKRIGLRLLSI